MRASQVVTTLLSGSSFRFREQFLYGHREILNAYAELPARSILLGRIQHGWDVWFEGHKRFRNTTGGTAWQWVWSAVAQDRAQQRGVPKVVAIGAPWLYLRDLVSQYAGSSDVTCDRHGTLFIPAHYGPYATPELHKHHVRSIVVDLDASATTVLLHGYDYVRPEIRSLYLRQGIRLECAGYPSYSPTGSPPSADLGNRVGFLGHVLRLMSRHERVATDFMGSHLFYAANAGLAIGYWPIPESYWNHLISLHDNENQAVFVRMREFESNWRPSLTHKFGHSPSLQSDADEILGVNMKMTRADLRKTLVWRDRQLPEGPEWQVPKFEVANFGQGFL